MCFGQLLFSSRDKRAVGEHLASGLAARAVVRLVVGVDDALHRRTAIGARQAEAAMHRHRRVKGGDLLRPVAGLAREARRPLGECRLRRLEKALDRRSVDRTRQRQRRQARAMQDLVGISVADAAEEARIGERALDGVVLGDEAGREGLAGRRHDVDAAGVERRQRGAAGDDVQRRAPLLAGLGEGERAAVELEESQRVRRGRLAGREPAQAAGDHEMDDDEEVAGEGEDDALAEALDAGDDLALDGRDRRRDRAQQERMADAHALEAMADDLGVEPLEIDADVGQFGHRVSVPARIRRNGLARAPSASGGTPSDQGGGRGE